MQLSDADKQYLISFVEEVLATVVNDDTSITLGLYDMALNAGVILGLSKAYMESID